MKKLFHRKKDSAPSSPEQTPPRSQRTDIAGAHPSFRASPYESTAPAHLPQTGQFPLKANSSSVSFQGQGRRSETYNRGHGTGATESSPRPSSSSPYYGSLPAPRVTSASYGNVNVGYPPTDGSTESGGAPNYQQRQGAAPSDSLTQNLSNLNFHSSKDPEDVPLPRHHGSNQFPANARETGYSSAAYERKPHGEDKLAGIRMVAAPEPTQPEEYVPRQTSDTVDRNRGGDEYYSRSYGHPNTKSSEYTLANGVDTEGIMQRKRSIPRKEVSNVPQTSGALADRTRHHAKSSSEPRYEHQDDHESRRQGNFRSQPVVHASSQKDAQAARPSAHEIVDRARGNTYDTEVDERIAPAVVHERVDQNIHHIREEVITREIHNHEVHHRILPIIDVEVLPPRHFLPVEGGGLVEISGKEVPGRGNNWVIAETASKIPSDQPAPKGSRRFTARQFPGTEGDAVEYTTPEGYPKTEQTWVHPPELETGGRDTGQTWPMEFGNERAGKAGRERKSSRTPKPKRSRKAMVPEASTVQQPLT